MTDQELEARVSDPQPGIVPKRGQIGPAARLELFENMASELSATMTRVPDPSKVPEAIAAYLRRENLPARLRLAPDPEVTDLDWSGETILQIEIGPAEESDATSVTPAFAGIAETGTLMLLSGAESPTTLNFLPENHIVVLNAGAVVGAYEEAWTRLRARYGSGIMPRTVNFITGPSRTADIEQTIQLGAHGPRRLHILLIEDEN